MHRAQHEKAALRCARHKTGKATPQPADIDRVKAVHVLRRVDRGDNAVRIDLPRQRKLNQHPVDAVVDVQLLDLGDKRLLRDFRRQPKLEIGEPGVGAGAALGTYIEFACWIVANQDRGETRGDCRLIPQARRNSGGALSQPGSDCAAVDNFSIRHPLSSIAPLSRWPTLLKSGAREEGVSPSRRLYLV